VVSFGSVASVSLASEGISGVVVPSAATWTSEKSVTPAGILWTARLKVTVRLEGDVASTAAGAKLTRVIGEVEFVGDATSAPAPGVAEGGPCGRAAPEPESARRNSSRSKLGRMRPPGRRVGPIRCSVILMGGSLIG